MLTKEEKMNLLDEWINRLGLVDWTIYGDLNATPSAFANAGADGECCYVDSTKIANVKIMREEMMEDGTDWEQVLVHELLHCKFALIYPENTGSTRARVTHQLIDDMSKALVSAKRGTVFRGVTKKLEDAEDGADTGKSV